VKIAALEGWSCEFLVTLGSLFEDRFMEVKERLPAWPQDTLSFSKEQKPLAELRSRWSSTA
jgi:hypothetical protein